MNFDLEYYENLIDNEIKERNRGSIEARVKLMEGTVGYIEGLQKTIQEEVDRYQEESLECQKVEPSDMRFNLQILNQEQETGGYAILYYINKNEWYKTPLTEEEYNRIYKYTSVCGLNDYLDKAASRPFKKSFNNIVLVKNIYKLLLYILELNKEAVSKDIDKLKKDLN